MDLPGGTGPLLFLDVDGVLNLWDAAVAVDRWSYPDGRLLLVPTGTAGRLARLAEVFTILWTTTWGSDAGEVFGPRLGVGVDWPVLDFDELKRPALVGAAGARRFAWVDDRASWELDGADVPVDVLVVSLADPDELGGPDADGQEAGAARGLVLVADPRRGLDERITGALLAFAVG